MQNIYGIGRIMKRKPEVTYQYHHIGVPTTAPRAGEYYSSKFKMYTSGGEELHGFHIQYHRFEQGDCLHNLIQTVPHIAFKVNDLDAAIKGEELLLEHYCQFDGFRVAMIEDNGVPIEFIETDLSEEDIWGKPKASSVIYPEAKVPNSPEDH